MDREAFFSTIRSGPLFGSRLRQEHVTGTEALLDASAKYFIYNAHHVANILAQVYHETGSYMMPVKETVYASHTNKNPPDSTVIARLNNAFAKGQLSWVRTPYWRTGWFGRGQIQITHEANYRKLGDRIGVDLVGNRDLALDPRISAEIAVVGMAEGLFTGKKLSDYNFPAALDAPPSRHPRRIVNGQDGTDASISRYHKAFHDALLSGGWIVTPPQEPIPDPSPPEVDPLPPEVTPPALSNEQIKKLLVEMRDRLDDMILVLGGTDV